MGARLDGKEPVAPAQGTYLVFASAARADFPPKSSLAPPALPVMSLCRLGAKDEKPSTET